MVFVLSESEKIAIVIMASCLFLASLVITICFVSPVCWLHKWLVRSDRKKKEAIKIQLPAQQLLAQESKHFQLSVVPHYGTNTDSNQKPKGKASNDYPLLTDKNNTKKQSIASDCEPIKQNIGKIKVDAKYESVSNASVKLVIKVIEVCELQPREYGVDPSCYVSIILIGLKNRRRSLIYKATPSELYRTATAKRCLNPVFNEVFVSQDLPKSILKDGLLRLKVFDDERYANDLCLGEMTLSLKKLDNNEEEAIKTYTLATVKEFKGELLVGMCYLPTSKRVTISIVRATLNHMAFIPSHTSVCFYVRILLFINGKLIKKKKTSTNQKMVWGDNEILTFDLMSFENEESGFMFVLSYKQESSQSPSSPETPVAVENSNESRKERHIGHFVVGHDFWTEMKQQPRKQIIKWHKIY